MSFKNLIVTQLTKKICVFFIMLIFINVRLLVEWFFWADEFSKGDVINSMDIFGTK